MSIEPAIKTILLGDSPVAALVSTRIYYINKPQNITSSCIVLQLLSTVRGLVFGGATGYSNGTLQITCFASRYETVKTLAAAVQTALHGFAGTQASTEVSFIKITSDSDIEVVPAEGRQVTKVYGVALDAECMVKE